MIKNDAIRTAAEIVKAQNQVTTKTLQDSGVLYCTNAKKGKYEIIRPNDLKIDGTEKRKLADLLVELGNENSVNKATIRSLQDELTQLKSEYAEFKRNVIDALGTLATTINEVDEEGDPL